MPEVTCNFKSFKAKSRYLSISSAFFPASILGYLINVYPIKINITAPYNNPLPKDCPHVFCCTYFPKKDSRKKNKKKNIKLLTKECAMYSASLKSMSVAVKSYFKPTTNFDNLALNPIKILESLFVSLRGNIIRGIFC